MQRTRLLDKHTCRLCVRVSHIKPTYFQAFHSFFILLLVPGLDVKHLLKIQLQPPVFAKPDCHLAFRESPSHSITQEKKGIYLYVYMGHLLSAAFQETACHPLRDELPRVPVRLSKIPVARMQRRAGARRERETMALCLITHQSITYLCYFLS